jgi:Purine nucleoside permease (NUP)
VLVLRTASNYDMPPTGEPAAALLAAETQEQGFTGYQSSQDAAYRVGSVVVKEAVTGPAISPAYRRLRYGFLGWANAAARSSSPMATLLMKPPSTGIATPFT